MRKCKGSFLFISFPGDEYYVECGGDFWPVHNDFTLVIVTSKQKQGPSQFDLSVQVKVPLPLCVDTLRALHDWSEEKGWCIEPLLPLTRLDITLFNVGLFLSCVVRHKKRFWYHHDFRRYA